MARTGRSNPASSPETPRPSAGRRRSPGGSGRCRRRSPASNGQGSAAMSASGDFGITILTARLAAIASAIGLLALVRPGGDRRNPAVNQQAGGFDPVFAPAISCPRDWCRAAGRRFRRRCRPGRRQAAQSPISASKDRARSRAPARTAAACARWRAGRAARRSCRSIKQRRRAVRGRLRDRNRRPARRPGLRRRPIFNSPCASMTRS